MAKQATGRQNGTANGKTNEKPRVAQQQTPLHAAASSACAATQLIEPWRSEGDPRNRGASGLGGGAARIFRRPHPADPAVPACRRAISVGAGGGPQGARRKIPPKAPRRELKEETGYTARNSYRNCSRSSLRPGLLGERMEIFLAEGLTKGEAQPEEDEKISKRALDAGGSRDAGFASGKIRDAKSVAGILYYASFVPAPATREA